MRLDIIGFEVFIETRDIFPIPLPRLIIVKTETQDDSVEKIHA